MRCNCSVVNAIVSAIVLIAALLGLYSSVLSSMASGWIVVIGAAIIFIHSLVHKHSN